MCDYCEKVVIRDMEILESDLPMLPYKDAKWCCIVPGCRGGRAVRDYGISPYLWDPTKRKRKKDGGWKGGWFEASGHYYLCSKHWLSHDRIAAAMKHRFNAEYFLTKIVYKQSKSNVMKNAMWFLLMAVSIALFSCSQGSKIDNTSPSHPVVIDKFTNYFPQWGNSLVFGGKDTMVGGYADKVVSAGLWGKDSTKGLCVYMGDTFRLRMVNKVAVSVAYSAANNYTLSGWYNDVSISGNGGSRDATLGVFQYLSGRSFYRLEIKDPSGMFLSKVYSDSL